MILDMTAFMTLFLLLHETFVTHLLAKISKRRNKKSQDSCMILLHNSIDEN